MRKVIIRPSKELTLAQVVSLKRDHQHVTVHEVEVDPQSGTWCLTLSGPRPGDEESFLADLHEKWTMLADGPKHVIVRWLPERGESPILVEQDLILAVQKRLPAAAGFLRAARLTLDQGVLVANVAHKIALDRLSRAEVREAVRHALHELYHTPLSFEVVLCDTLRDELEKEMSQTPRVSTQVKVESTPAKPRSPRRRRGLSTIGELEQGSSMVDIEGEVFKVERRQFGSGKLLTTLWVTDHEDAIQVKHRCKTTDCCSFSPGSGVRVSGIVAHDRFTDESVVNARQLEPILLKRRQDTRDDQRVELHLHSKMSAMDGLCTPSKLMDRLAHWGHKAVAITDHGVIQAFPQMHGLARKHGIKVIYGMEGYLVEDEENDATRYHIILLAQDETGLGNLYRLVSRSHLEHYYRVPRIPRRVLKEHREGLLLGTACQAGELYQAVLVGADDERLAATAAFYDYIEIQPLENNAFLVTEGRVGSMDELAAINRRLVALGDALHKPVVATGDVHYLEPTDEMSRRILLAGQGYRDQEHQAPLFLHTTDEMLERMAHLGQDDAYRTVVEASSRLASSVKDLAPLRQGLFPPVLPRAGDDIEKRAVAECERRYGNPLPPAIARRLDKELTAIIGQGYAGIYSISSQLVARSRQDGYLVGSRGSVGSSLVATMCGITEVNPLPPHYFCQECRYVRFLADGTVASGFDLSDESCPECGSTLLKEGQDIPFETFMGFEGEKVPDIDLNFSGEYQAQVHRQAEAILGDNRVYRAGTIATLADKTAYGFVKGYMNDMNVNWKKAQVDRMVDALTGVKRTTGQHPGGLMIVPAGYEAEDFSPVQYPADDRRSGVVTTHFDYQAVHDNLVKLDLLGHDDPTSLRMLQDLTGVDPLTIPFDDRETLAIFSGVESLGLRSDDWELPVGTAGIPEFGTRFVRKMLLDTSPHTFSELVRVSGLSHGTDVWLNNAQNLIKQRTADISQVISSRDDITVYLIYRGIEPSQAFGISEAVRKGKQLEEEQVRTMQACGVPEWYIASCRKIKYLFPKAHAVAYVMMAFRIAYFKVHYPLPFYATYFSTRASALDGSLLIDDNIWEERLRDLLSRASDLTAREQDTANHLEVAMEMKKRGFGFLPPDLYASDGSHFIIKGQQLLVPFTALPGMGQGAAQRIIKARSERPFLSVEDLRSRARLSKNLMEMFLQCGCLHDLPERNQLSLFGEY